MSHPENDFFEKPRPLEADAVAEVVGARRQKLARPNSSNPFLLFHALHCLSLALKLDTAVFSSSNTGKIV
jgi:hypothetical protein